MAEQYSFFDSVENDDREYNAQQFTDYFRNLVTTGIMRNSYNQLEVSVNGSNMISSIKSGVAFIEGRYYYNDSLLELTHDVEVLGLNRIDRIVARLDLNTEARHVKVFIKKGTANTNPVAPTLTRNASVYEISLAQVLITGGQTYISSNGVTDERGTDSICPWAGSNILPSFDDNALADHINNNAAHVKASQDEWIIATLGPQWTNVVGQLKYYKDQMGIVRVYGVIKYPNTLSGAATTITTLPVGYRPISNVYVTSPIANPVQTLLLTMNTNGVLSVSETKADLNFVVNISFRAEQ